MTQVANLGVIRLQTFVSNLSRRDSFIMATSCVTAVDETTGDAEWSVGGVTKYQPIIDRRLRGAKG